MAHPDLTKVIKRIPARAKTCLSATRRPLVTLTYAQSLDGSIAARRDQRLVLSSPQSKQMTHQLRAAHDSILVGIGTVIADDPKLTARSSESRNPQPVIVDSHLRTPMNCQLLQRKDCHPWIAATYSLDQSKVAEFTDAGAEIIPFDSAPDGRVPLDSLLDELGQRGITSLMVEGGAQVITSFLSQNLVDWVLITLAPRFIGGVHAVESLDNKSFPEISALMSEMVGPDLILWGDIAR